MKKSLSGSSFQPQNILLLGHSLDSAGPRPSNHPDRFFRGDPELHQQPGRDGPGPADAAPAVEHHPAPLSQNLPQPPAALRPQLLEQVVGDGDVPDPLQVPVPEAPQVEILLAGAEGHADESSRTGDRNGVDAQG